ncbi:hypothetical protein [Hylemonella gracilis]|uniref:hypothetical protein n=1 Tax=Hylemonella gracilis TaxID=80880 RepID=UPI001110A448|nr:hypothetical protein [Hylemonella gracilis]
MTLPSLDPEIKNGKPTKSRIYLLEVRDRKEPERNPIAWVLIERQEKFQKNEADDSVLTASVQISYECITPRNSYRVSGKGKFFGSYSRNSVDGMPMVALTSPNDTLFFDPIELRGQRIGTYLMNEIVLWVQQWPEARVRPIKLVAGQAGEDNKERRNLFYTQFGIKFDFRDSEQREGVSKPMLVKELTPVENWKESIGERDVREYISEMLSERDLLKAELSRRKSANETLISERRLIEAHPIRWVWNRLLPGVVSCVLLLSLPLVVALALVRFFH